MNLLWLLLRFYAYLVVFIQLWWSSFSHMYSNHKRRSSKIGKARNYDYPTVLVEDYLGSRRNDKNMRISVDPMVLRRDLQDRVGSIDH